MPRDFVLRGDNSRAFYTRNPRVLLAGPSGTGKTLTWLLKLYCFGCDYAGTRMLLARKTRSSLTDTGLVTWERNILGPTHPMLTKRPNLRRVRHEYQFDNGSTLTVGGLDKPDRVLSSDYDLIYLLEATDFSLDDFETLAGRLRTGIAPYQQIIADCNPTFPTHWLFQQCKQGKMLELHSKHKDNPAYWDKARNRWTKLGRRYVETTLKNMSGARRKRFYEGKWAAAEGLVYDGYSENVHLLDPYWRPPDHWRRFWTIDWGFTAPLVIQMWALDADGRMYLYRELYQTGMRVEIAAKHCRALVEANDELRPMAIVCDHDPEAMATWRAHSGLPAEAAWKEDKYEGIELTQARFDPAGDGRPRIFFSPTARFNPQDDALAAEGRPTSTVEELPGYIWDRTNPDKLKEEPVKINDHGMDAMRYGVVYAETATGSKQFASTGKPADTHYGDIRNQSW